MYKLLCYILLFPFALSAQEYIPMLQEGNSWSVDVFYCPYDPPNNPDEWTETEQISIGEEVLIDGIAYKQLYRDGDESCLLREEDGVVYKLISSNNEMIFFDFNMEVGDEFYIADSGFQYPYCAGTGYNIPIFFIKVYEVEMLFIAGQERKVINFIDKHSPNDGHVLSWIEGIGTLAGPGHTWALQDATCGSLLACFSNNGETYFMNGAGSCDNTSLGIGDISEEEIVLYPNPITNTSFLQLPSASVADRLKIFTINGKLIGEELITKDYIPLQATQYSAGLYFYRVLSEGRVLKTAAFLVK